MDSKFPQVLNVIRKPRYIISTQVGTYLEGSEHVEELLGTNCPTTVAIYKLVEVKTFVKKTKTEITVSEVES